MKEKEEIKQKVHSIQERTVADIKDKALAAGIKSKDRVVEQVKTEATNQAPQKQRAQDMQSPESYATDHVEDTAQSITEYTAHTGERAVRYGVQKMKEHRTEKLAVEQIEREDLADELIPEDLWQKDHYEPTSLERTAPIEQVHSREALQEYIPKSNSVSGLSNVNETTISRGTVQPNTSLNRQSISTKRDIKTNEPFQKEARVPKEPLTAVSGRIKQKQSPTAKEKTNTSTGQIRTQEQTIRSNDSLKAPNGQGNTTERPSVLPSKQFQPNQKQATKQTRTTGTVLPSERQTISDQEKEAPKAALQKECKEVLSSAEKEDIRPRAKEKTTKANAETATIKKEHSQDRDKVEKKKAAQSKKEQSLLKADQKKKPTESAPVETYDAQKRPVLKQKKKTPPKVRQKPTLQKAVAERPIPKTSPSGLKKINQRNGGPYGVRSIKTVSEKTKEAEKAATKTAKAAKKATKTVKQAEERTKRTVQQTKQAAKGTAKAVVKAVKASAEAISGVAELLGVSVSVVLLIIIVCLIAAIGGTCFGIFLSNDKSSGSEMTMSQTITQLTTDYYDSITKFQGQYNYDELEVKGSTAINWKDVLTIYAVKYTNGFDGFEVVTLDKKKLKKIKSILLDMNPCTGVVVEKVVPVTKTTTVSRGQKISTTTYETQKVLIVTAVHVGATEQAALYDFSDDAKAQVKELLSSDYDELWNEIIGSSGEIIISSSTHVPNFIFAWPLDGDYRISSQFGTRTDPINGVVKTHGGTDIAAATGTPILAAADGTVEIAGYNAGGYGYYVKLSHGDGYETLYGHCSVLLVSTGQPVKQGQVIAKVGSTGHSTGPHLHFEVRYNGNKVNPMQFFEM